MHLVLKNRRIHVCKLGLVGYGEALSLQDRLVDLRCKDDIDDTLLLLEHRRASNVELAFFRINAAVGFVVLAWIWVGR